MREFDGSNNLQKPLKAQDIWPELKKLLNLPDEAVKAVRIDIQIGGLVEVEVRKYAVAQPSFRSNQAPVTKPATAEESST